MYVNLIPLEDQARSLIEAIDGIESPSERLTATLRLEHTLAKGIDQIRRKSAYELVRASQATDAAIEAGVDPRKVHRWANSWAIEKNLPHRRLRRHDFDPEAAVRLRASRSHRGQVVPIRPNASQEPPAGPESV
jgi:hypothetical protein